METVMDVRGNWQNALPKVLRGGNDPKANSQKAEDRVTLVGVMPETAGVAEQSDGELMQLIGAGDSQALETLYDRHVRGCFGLSMKIVRDPLVAEEVVQDVFMKLWSKPDSFSPERGKFSSWLLTLVHNRSVDKLRRLKSQGLHTSIGFDVDGEGASDPTEMLPDQKPGPDEEAWRGERAEIMQKYLGMLPEAQRQTLFLAYYEGLTQREIAERLQQPIGTIKTRTRAALLQMRGMLATQNLLGDL